MLFSRPYTEPATAATVTVCVAVQTWWRTPTVLSYKLAKGGSTGCSAALPVGVRLLLRDAPDCKLAEVGDLGDLDGRGVVYEVDGCSWSSFFLVKSSGVK